MIEAQARWVIGAEGAGDRFLYFFSEAKLPGGSSVRFGCLHWEDGECVASTDDREINGQDGVRVWDVPVEGVAEAIETIMKFVGGK